MVSSEEGEEVRGHKRMLLVSGLVLGLVLSGVGVLLAYLFSLQDQAPVVVSSADNKPSALEKQTLVVDVSGAVIRPGVYHLPADSRVSDALTAAGGLASDASRDWVAQTVNLAAKLTDGYKLYIPSVQSTSTSSDINSTSFTTNDVVHINSANLSLLDSLWGVGATRAASIVQGRPYTSIEELVTKHILTQSIFDRNRGRLAL